MGALLFLDGYQDCGTRPIDVKDLDVDFLRHWHAGSICWGRRGSVSFTWRRELIETLTPTMTSWMAQRDPFAFDTKRHDPSPHARRFEGGSPPIPNIFMARPAIDLLAAIGMDNVAAQIERLTQAFLKGVGDLRIDCKTPSSSVGPLVVLRARDADAVVAKLAARGIAVSSRRDGVRFAFHVYNTVQDVDVALTSLADNLGLMVRS